MDDAPRHAPQGPPPQDASQDTPQDTLSGDRDAHRQAPGRAAPSSDVAFSDSVKRVQSRRGSRETLRRMGFATRITPALMEFVSERDSAYLGTAGASGQPYIQHRGGPAGFIRRVGENTLGFADYRGNRQYISTGNLLENPKAFLFLMDYEARHRVKLWGTVRLVEDDPALLARLMPEGYAARPVQAVLFDVVAWDSNCPSHIPRKIGADAVAARVQALTARIEALERRNLELANEVDRLKRATR